MLLFTRDGTFVARVDLIWHQWAVVDEADGRGKYSTDGPAALLEEKRPEDRIRDLGLKVVRWDVPDLLTRFEQVPDRLAAARRRGHPDRFTGQWAPTPAPGQPTRGGSALRHTAARAPADPASSVHREGEDLAG